MRLFLKSHAPDVILTSFWYEKHCDFFQNFLTIFQGRAPPLKPFHFNLYKFLYSLTVKKSKSAINMSISIFFSLRPKKKNFSFSVVCRPKFFFDRQEGKIIFYFFSYQYQETFLYKHKEYIDMYTWDPQYIATLILGVYWYQQTKILM